MAEKEGGGGDNGILSWFIWVLIGLGIVWFATGGPARESARSGTFIRPLAPVDSGQTYGGSYINPSETKKKTHLELPENAINLETLGEDFAEFAKKVKEAELLHKSPLSSKPLIIDGFSGTETSDPQKEYLRILASTKNSTVSAITGIKIKSTVTNKEVTIPQAVKLPILGMASKTQIVSLVPGERAIIHTGRSPIGESFQVNICSGYLTQFQDYTPELRLECPKPEDELEKYGINDSVCENFVEDIPRCTIYTKTLPAELSAECKAFVSEKINYNSCVMNHKNDTNFYRNEWRIFLGKTNELWKEKREIIKILDSKNNVLDAITY